MKQTAPAQSSMPKSKIDFGLTDLALLSMTLIWGINFIVVKTALSELLPLAFLGLRFAIASAVFFLFLRVRQGGFKIPRREWSKVAFVGIIGTTIYQPLFINGLALTKASNTSLLLATTPAFIVLINRVLYRERFAARGWLGILLSFVGITFIVFGGGDLALDSAALLGDVLVLGGTLCWAMYSVLAAPLLKRYSSLEISALTTLLGTLPLLIITLPALLTQNWSKVGIGSAAGLLYSGVFAIVVAYIIWNLGVQRIGGARTAIYSNITPIIATVAAAIFLHEELTLFQLVGACVIFIGLYFARTAHVVVEPEG